MAVGGAIVLFPEHLHTFTFGYGYVDPPSGFRRFAYWAEYGLQHVTIFLGFLLASLWIFPTAGFLLLGGLLAQLCYTWHSFLVDYSIPLGDDDYQTVYLLAASTWLNGEPINIKELGGLYYASPDDPNARFVDLKEDWVKED